MTFHDITKRLRPYWYLGDDWYRPHYRKGWRVGFHQGIDTDGASGGWTMTSMRPNARVRPPHARTSPDASGRSCCSRKSSSGRY